MNMFNYFWPVLMIVGANVCYHITAKSMPEGINPLASLTITYAIAALVSTVLYFITSPVRNLIIEYTHLNWAPFVFSFALVGLEFGSIYMYRVGWNISIGSLVAGIVLAIVLIAVGLILYHENISLQQLIGVGLCMGGLILINK